MLSWGAGVELVAGAGETAGRGLACSGDAVCPANSAEETAKTMRKINEAVAKTILNADGPGLAPRSKKGALTARPMFSMFWSQLFLTWLNH